MAKLTPTPKQGMAQKRSTETRTVTAAELAASMDQAALHKRKSRSRKTFSSCLSRQPPLLDEGSSALSLENELEMELFFYELEAEAADLEDQSN